jgi:hypothetical protein
MAVLDEMVVVAPDVTTTNITIDDIKAAIARQFWAYFYAHQNDKLISRKVVFWSVTIYLRDLYPLFVHLFGNPDSFTQ